MPPPLPADLAADSTATLQALCLAQAQELTYAKAAADGKAAPLLARFAQCAGQPLHGLLLKLQSQWASTFHDCHVCLNCTMLASFSSSGMASQRTRALNTHYSTHVALHRADCITPDGMLSLEMVYRACRIAKQAEAHYSAAQLMPKSDALQRNMGRTIPVRCSIMTSVAVPSRALNSQQLRLQTNAVLLYVSVNSAGWLHQRFGALSNAKQHAAHSSSITADTTMGRVCAGTLGGEGSSVRCRRAAAPGGGVHCCR